ncbi:hypothetical protein HYT56_00290 [Candidatus Woesearchaeota archaeon]|nr:hypothetical protein [Candidatus Woesearchaeota archaeon]
MKIILDTNFLLDCVKFHIDYQEELRQHELYVLDKTISELENLINQKKASHAKVTLQILEKKKIKILKTGNEKKSVDSILAEKDGYAVATADKELKQRLKKRKIFVIRQKKFIKEI